MAGETAYDLFAGEFADWGIPESLTVWAYERYKELGADEGAASRVAEEMKARPEFKARFPAFEELARRGEAMSVDEYLDYEQQVRKTMKMFGVDPLEFGSDEKIGQMLTNRVSPEEARSRMEMAAFAAYQAPAEVKRALATSYGVTEGDLVAYWLEPDEALPVLQRKFGAAQVRGAMMEQGLDMSTDLSEQAADRGYSYDQSREAAQRARSLDPLSGGEQTASRDDIAAAQFGDVAAQKRVERAAKSRAARFGGGGGAAEGQQGVSGLASSTGR